MKRKTTSLFGLALALLAAGSSAQDGPTLLQVRAKEIVLADGERIEDGVLIVADGVVRRVGRGVEIDELQATEVKKAITGHGHATKLQMQQAVQWQCGLDELPSPHDVADALAIALCAARRLATPPVASAQD